MDHALRYDEPVIGLKERIICWDRWENARKLYDEKQYRKSLIEVLRFLDPGISLGNERAEAMQIHLSHGSTGIFIKITPENFDIQAPFLRLPDKRRVPLLRQVSEFNFANLILSQIVLQDDELQFQFQDRIELSHPNKVYGIIREMCLQADYYDDLFIEKFGAELLQPPDAEPFTDTQKNQCWEFYQDFLRDILSYSEYLQKERQYESCCECLATGMVQLVYTIQPQGLLRSALEDYVQQIRNQENFQDAIHRGEESIKKLQAMDREKFDHSLYVPNLLFSGRGRAELPHIQEMLRDRYEAAKQERASNSHAQAYFTLNYSVQKILYDNDIPFAIEKTFNEGLLEAAGKPWREAAESLWHCVQTVMEMQA